ncbi:hypothetical protein KFE25_003960 [Diacronema lutheri]|uniref:Exostosin GT47 domain-containing protein n=1 Tax=Diacronema lutheri TaxID=2081491 RepID=A0A8J6C6M1_DIALT|nr:hypothetical protein KFE25_003960 [Diacronema lutheri]
MRTRTVVAATAPFVIAVGIATSTRLPPWRAPRVVVGELFRDILSCPVPGLPSGRDAPCPMLDAKERLRRAPWLSREQAASARLPSLADLNATMLSQASLYNPTRTECAGSSARLSLASHEVPGGNLCVHQVLGGLSTLLFDQFTTEALVLQRYLQRWPLCEPRPADEACGADLVADTCGADVVVVPSLVFHSIIASGRRGWFWVRCMRMRSLVKDYWRRLMGRYYTPGRRPGPLIVIIESHTFDTTVIHWLLDELGDLPDEFSSRVLIACYNSNLSRVQRRPFWRPRTSAHLRNSTLAPPEATTIQSGGELELRRRARLLIAAARAHTPPPFHFGGPLIVSIPERSDGVLGGHQFIRRVIVAALRDAGAHCSPGGDLCVLCARGGDACVRLAAGVARGRNAAAKSVSKRHLADGMLAEAVHSSLCIEPPGDTFGRSHTYLAALAGCVPVLIDGGHTAYDVDEPTWWAWRAPEGVDEVGSELPEARGLLRYSRFSVVLKASQLAGDARMGLARGASRRWVAALLALAADKGAMSQMRGALHAAARSFVFKS